MVRFTRARTHVHIMCMYTIQRCWYDMIHDIPKLRMFPLWRIWVHIVTCTEDGNIQGMRGVRKHSYIQQEEQNMRQPSLVALNRNTAVQQY